MEENKIRVLIVDDSSFVRKALTRIFSTDPLMEVVGTAASGKEAIEKTLNLHPDLVTLDIMMPDMDGIETLRILMEKYPVAVLMLSQYTKEGAELTLKALEIGAMDFVDKSTAGMMDIQNLAREILDKSRSIAGTKPLGFAVEERAVSSFQSSGLVDIVAIGSSTGGPMALQMILPKFPENVGFATVIVQHMPVGFTAPFAKRMDTLCAIEVREAQDGDLILPGHAYVAPAGLHMTIRKTSDRTRVRLGPNPDGIAHRPSVDVLFNSVAHASGDRTIGVLLTGMGTDGASGLELIKQNGGYTIAQDEATSTVFGMPHAAIERNIVDSVLPITSIADEILKRS